MRHCVRFALMFAFAGVLALVPLLAQQHPFFPGGTYDPAVPTPDSVLGYPIGTYHTDYAGLERWLAALGRSSRVRIMRYGLSVERRPLYLIVISAPSNLAKLDAIRAGMNRLADPRSTTDAEAEQIAVSLPGVAWMNHATDGNESAAFESAIQTSYQLAAGTDATTTLILDRLVTVVNPAHNPESHERFVAWYNSVQVGSAGTSDRAAAEHHAPWGMSTNNNHYQIDLNRDAFFVSQNETKAIVKAFGEWNPVVFVDHHGQTKNMFFPPPADAVNLNVTRNQLDWMDRYGRAIADGLDKQGASYYRRGRFDLFYAGFWDSWPTLNGSVGMTFETDGGGGKGLAWEREDGTVLSLRDGVLHHHTGTMAVLKLTAEQKDQRLRDFYQYKKTAMDEGRRDTMKQVVILPGRDEARALELVRTLRLQRVEVQRVTASFTLLKAHPYTGGGTVARDVPVGAYLVAMAQPQKRLAKALLEVEPAFTDEFLKNEERKKERAELVGEWPRDGFYDTTAWSLPLLFGVDAVWAEDPVPAGGLSLVTDEPPSSVAAPAPATYGYLFSSGSLASVRLLSQLLKEGFNLAVATQPFRVQDEDFPRGSILARVERNSPSLHARMVALSTQTGVRVHSLNTARVQTGVDFGEDPVVELKLPRLAIVTGDPTDDRSYGAAWFMIEDRLGLPFTAIQIDQLKTEDLSRYNVIVLPHGSPAGFQEALGGDGLARLRRWAENGGTLVLIKGAAAFATRKGVEWTTSTLKRHTASVRLFFERPGEEKAAGKPGEKPDQRQGEEKPPTREMDLIRTPGAILRVKIDPEHYLGFGYDGDIGATVTSNFAFTISTRGRNVAAFPGEDQLRLAGFMWPEAKRALARTLFAWQESAGRGQIILFAEDPNFRVSQLSTLRLFVNAVLLGPAFVR